MEVDVDTLIARSVRVRDIRRQRLVALAGALDGALEGLSFSPAKDASAGATRADGSTVDIDSESAKLAANALEQQAAVQVAHARLGILKAAMGVSS